MAGTDWDKEMKKIDKQLESISDDALISPAGAKAPAEKARVAEVQRTTSTFGVFARLVLAVILGLAMLFWPYSVRCGPGLFACSLLCRCWLGTGLQVHLVELILELHQFS